jgi:soluble lytic murein transglycosylase-like protein
MTEFRALIAETAVAHDLSPDVVEAIVVTESSGNPRAYRYEPAFWDRYLKDKPAYKDADPRRVSASYGLMQVMYPVACELGFSGEPEDLYDPETNLKFGCTKLAQLMTWADGRFEQAVAAYNTGKGNWRSVWGAHYVGKVRKQLEALRA